MPRVSPQKQFSKLMQKLVGQRKKLAARVAKLQAKLADIDAMFAPYGIDLGSTGAAKGKAKGPAKATRGGKRRRKHFAISGEESILGFVKAKGNPTTAELNQHWQSEGRGGKADNALTKLTQKKTLKRMKNKEGRGSRYTLS
jgi:hypothetical protein